MDVHITYETLFDLLRKERSLEELQTLDQKFWKYVIDYMNERDEMMKSSSRPGEQEKAKIQLHNIKRILKEIYERRERKILHLALNVIRTEAAGYVDTKNMLAEEKSLFDETLAMLRKYKDGILLSVFENRLPTIVPEDHYETDADDQGHDITTREEEGEVDLNETDNGQYPEKEIVRSES
ncbi:MAG: hypothetical protein ACQESE_04950, partial [Nanobdellota archaeon]